MPFLPAVGKPMDYIGHNIAVNLKRIRKARNLSLDIIAEQTGVSKSMLSQIERGNANPSIGVLAKITSGLRIEFEDLIQPPAFDACIVHILDTTPTKEVVGKYRVWTCFPYQDNHKVEIYRIEIEPHAYYESGSHGAHTREYITMIEGELSIDVDGKNFIVQSNDAFRFESDQFHVYRNSGDQKCSFMSFFTDYAR